ncbi:MAG: ADP-ribosylglycohydrolase family protein [Planctomycetota bacterium]
MTSEDLTASSLAEDRMIDSLVGLSVGDAFGSRFFGPVDLADAADARRVPTEALWRVTDDTWMALSVVEILRRHGRIDQDDLARSFGEHYQMGRGYGAAMHGLLARFRSEKQWREPARQVFYGQGSFGNGSAMRIAPLGAFHADRELDFIVEEAERSAVVTHTHAEAAAGAIATTVAAALAWRARETPVEPADFIRQVLAHVPSSEVAKGIRRAIDFDATTAVEHVAAMLGNGSHITCQDTVPYCIWLAAHNLADYETAMWNTIRGAGDIDTTCAIVGGIVATHTGRSGVPAQWIERRERLPEWPFRD